MHLLIIDPQNDFMDMPGSALPVPDAQAHMNHVADLIRKLAGGLHGITVTLDTHQILGIERTTFWHDAEGTEVAPYTEITAEDVESGRLIPLDGAERVLGYLRALEEAGRYRLRAWPVHCVHGTWGANVYEPLMHALMGWAVANQRNPHFHPKGMNPWTEQYGAFGAEIVDEADRTTWADLDLIDRVMGPDNEKPRLLVAGEASSHCVLRSVEQLLEAGVDPTRITLLKDCMGPVPGCEQLAEAFFAKMGDLGMRVSLSTEVA